MTHIKRDGKYFCEKDLQEHKRNKKWKFQKSYHITFNEAVNAFSLGGVCNECVKAFYKKIETKTILV